jgi:hypothetical protein
MDREKLARYFESVLEAFERANGRKAESCDEVAQWGMANGMLPHLGDVCDSTGTAYLEDVFEDLHRRADRFAAEQN